MSARCLPERPRFRSRAERVAFHALASKLRDIDVLLANVRFTGLDGDWEVDLVVGMPDAGFAAIEVKGGHVWRADGTWWQQTPQGKRAIDLEDQATSGKYLLRRYLKRHPGWKHGEPRMIHMVILPDTALGPQDPSPGLPRAWIIDRSELADAAGRIFDLLTGPLRNEAAAHPGIDMVDDVAAILGGRGDQQKELAGMLAVRSDHVDRLTEGQYQVLDVARRIPRIEVIGGPGTGKTWLAIEQARRWAVEGQKVALVCYSRGLSTWIARRVASWPKALRRNVRVRTYHALGVEWGVQIGDARDQTYWDVTMPAQMTELARALPDEQRFDALIVDEAQDCPDAWWPSLLACLRDPATARIAVFADEQQRIFDRDDRPDLGLVPLTLDANLRNSRQIGAVFAPLAADTPHLHGGEGPPVRFTQCSAAEAMETADDAAVGLLDQGWDPQDVALLTTHHRHPEQANRVALDGRDGYWDSFWDGTDLFFSTVAAFKGLERPAIVLAVDGFRDPATAAEILYVGLSRARDLLVVCGDIDLIRGAAGDEVADRLLGRG
ncbi:MAG TPA: ATP-binding domain-containing protein [Motilibacterales bacterium]|nr:ATP-binding domain-containing protein [Motilibacterales bacterium]